MMKFDVVEVFKYPTLDKEWVRKLVMITAPLAVVYLISSLIRFSSNILDVLSEFSDTADDFTYLLIYMGLIGVALLFSLASLPLMLYISGYTLEATRSVMAGNRDTLPEHVEIGHKMLDGLKLWLARLPYYIGLTLAWVIALAIFFFGAVVSFTDGGSIPIGVVMMIFAGLLVLAMIAVSFVLTFFVMPTTTYQYLKYNSVTAAWDLKKVYRISKLNWKNFGLSELITYVASIITGIVSFVLTFCLIGWIAQAAGFVWLGLVRARLLGQAFAEAEE
ncbi:MAG: DUF4013 domain-containing protein [Candidatus Dojkabacteria bacterium]|nr:MAG: DUF4013 domain-containing protein [Candidatus Dojkabacteria bacterium]